MNGRFERKGDIYLSGIGLALGDGVLYGLTVISTMSIATAINNEGIDAMMAGLTQNDTETMPRTMDAIAVRIVALFISNPSFQYKTGRSPFNRQSDNRHPVP